MKYRIVGDTMPAVEIMFDSKGESVFTQSGGMTWMSDGIAMATNTRGGLMKGIGRMFAGESLFMATYTAQRPGALIAFASTVAGQIYPLDVSATGGLICQKGAFLCAQDSVNVNISFTKKISSGFFGGEGFILQDISGQGIAFLEVDGDLVEKQLVTDQIVLTIGFDRENMIYQKGEKQFRGEVATDRYGRKVPKHAHGTANLEKWTSSTKKIMEAVLELYDRIVDQRLLVRRITITANHVVSESAAQEKNGFEQLSLFDNDPDEPQKKQQEQEELEREKKMQKAVLDIKKKFGKNAILKGMNLQEGATAVERNSQIGGHKA